MAGKKKGFKHMTMALSQRVVEAMKGKEARLAEACDSSLRSIHRWKGMRRAPAHYRKAFLQVLEISEIELSEDLVRPTSYEPRPKIDSIDLLPILKVVVDSNCEKFNIGDLHFLLSVQIRLPSPMSGSLVAELLRNKHTENGESTA